MVCPWSVLGQIDELGQKSTMVFRRGCSRDPFNDAQKIPVRLQVIYLGRFDKAVEGCACVSSSGTAGE